MSGRPSERGAALVVTLIFVAAMAAAAVAFIAGRQTDALALRGQLQGVEAQAMLEAALQQTVTVLNNRENGQRVPPQLTWQFGDVAVRVQLVSENGKVDLNKAEKPLLQGLAEAVGLDTDAAQAVADSVLDWRDENKTKLAHGAEGRDYRRGEHGSSGTADRPFSHPTELRYVLPVDAVTWDLLAPFVTVYSGEAEPDTNKAAPQVRKAMGLAQELAQSDAQNTRTESGSGSGQSGSGDGSTQSSGLSSGSGDPSSGSSSFRSRGSGFSDSSSSSSLSSTTGRSSGLSSSTTAGKLSGSPTQGSTLSKLESPSERQRRDTAANAGGAAAGADDISGVQTVVLDVRFANGYEAAAKAVIVLSQDDSEGDPFTVLDWTPIVRTGSSGS